MELAGMMSVEENKVLVQRLYDDLYNRGRLGLVDEFVAPDFVDHGVPAGTLSGPDGVRAAVRRLLHEFPDRRYVIEDLVAEGDLVMVRLTFSGTPAGRMRALQRSSDKIVQAQIHLHRLAGGRSVERWTACSDREPAGGNHAISAGRRRWPRSVRRRGGGRG